MSRTVRVTVPAKYPGVWDGGSPSVMFKKTGIQVSRGDRIIVTYLGGTWKANPSWPRAYDANGNPNIKARSGYLMPGKNEGGLVARINIGKRFFIGNSNEFVAPESGELQFSINDSLGSPGPRDNSGEVRVRVEVKAA